MERVWTPQMELARCEHLYAQRRQAVTRSFDRIENSTEVITRLAIEINRVRGGRRSRNVRLKRCERRLRAW
jgi:hypothetical protein